MSYDFIVYARRELVPAPDQFAARLEQAGAELRLADPFPNLEPRGGVVRASLVGKAVAVDVLYGTIGSSEATDLEADIVANGEEMTPGNREAVTLLRTCDTRITLSGKAADEIEAARRLATALAAASAGYVCDPQTDTTVRP